MNRLILGLMSEFYKSLPTASSFSASSFSASSYSQGSSFFSPTIEPPKIRVGREWQAEIPELQSRGTVLFSFVCEFAA